VRCVHYEELSTFQLQDLLERLTLDAVPDDLLLSAAESNLASFAAIGVVDKFPEAMRRFAAVFGCKEVPSLFDERHNIAPEPFAEANLDSKTRLAILSATQVDIAFITVRLTSFGTARTPVSTEVYRRNWLAAI